MIYLIFGPDQRGAHPANNPSYKYTGYSAKPVVTKVKMPAFPESRAALS
jgi:hypothetical protein